jgi:hypothetical protein
MIKHFLYAGGWKKFEPLWNFAIKSKNLNSMLPLLEAILSKVSPKKNKKVTKPLIEPPALNDFDINAAVAELKSKQNRVVHDHA